METPTDQLAAMPYDQAIETIMRESVLPMNREDAEEVYRFTVSGSDVLDGGPSDRTARASD